MKQLTLGAALFLFTVSLSCGSSSSNASPNAKDAGIETANASSTGDAVFSYNLDGTTVSGGEVDAVMMNNAVFITPSDKGNKYFRYPGDWYLFRKTETGGKHWHR